MIRFDNVGKVYTTVISRRRTEALAGFSMEMARGEVVGIAGPNGAGKSTLISLLMGFITPTSGTITIDGKAPRMYVEGHGISYLTELVNLPNTWQVKMTLRRLARLSGLASADAELRAAQMQTELGLDEHALKSIKQLSKGNLQRVGLAQSLLGDFDVVVLDEPTHGLDPLWTQRFRDVVAALRRPDRLILIASHNLDELERLADRVVILDHGQLQRVVASDAARPASQRIGWRVTFEDAVDFAAALPGATSIDGRAGTWRVDATRTELSATLGRLLSNGAVLIECAPEESNLESAFRAAVQR
jgi:ABC-2 type transport system ATP-binding protein